MSGTEPEGVEPKSGGDEVEILVQALEATPYSRLEGRDRKRWSVRLEVTSVVAGEPEVTAGDIVVLRVHSVAKTFMTDVADLPGRDFRLHYHDGFATDWSGKVSVDPP